MGICCKESNTKSQNIRILRVVAQALRKGRVNEAADAAEDCRYMLILIYTYTYMCIHTHVHTHTYVHVHTLPDPLAQCCHDASSKQLLRSDRLHNILSESVHKRS
jgi:hypothetical protein